MRYDSITGIPPGILRSLALAGWEDWWKRQISKSGNFGIQIIFLGVRGLTPKGCVVVS
jgi:hypothetical protein